MNKKAARRRAGAPASDVLEAAVRLLRGAPASTLLLHFIGSVPCLLGALYFLADMSQSAFAAERLLPSSLGLAALYLWMKCWQAAFAAHLRALLLLEAPPRWTFGRIVRLAAVQCALHPLGLVLRPLALVITLPYVWTAMFFQNVTALGDGREGLRAVCRHAGAQARLWPRQAHVLALLLLLFGFFVWVNVAIALVALPAFLKMFFGIETAFSMHLGGYFNTTFFSATFAGLYLCIDPIRKAAVVVRCFHGSSLRSGDDLEVQLRTFRATASTLAAFALGALIAFHPLPASAQRAPRVEPAELSRSIDDVLEGREFSWRSPRVEKQIPAAEETLVQRWRREFGAWLDKETWKLGRWFGRVLRKLDKWFSSDRSRRDRSEGAWDWLGAVRNVLYVLLAVALTLLMVMIVRARRRSRSRPVEAEAIAPLPDLTREDVTADQLPEEGWLQMARDLIERGELRLALRASYLAALAHLGGREMIHLARHKSNRDYDRELRRRARGDAELIDSFDRSLLTFERSWYGEHEVTRDTLGVFAQYLERIRAC